MTLAFLGQHALPPGWSQRPLLAVAKEVRSKNTGLLERNLLSLSYGRIVRKDIHGVDGLLPASFEGYNRVQEGDLVMRLTDLQNDQRSLRTGYVGECGIITSAYVTLRPMSISARYFSYVMHAYDVSKAFYTMGGGLRQGMGFDDLKRMTIPVPPLDVQRRIADFLDDQVGGIEKVQTLRRRQRDALVGWVSASGGELVEALQPTGWSRLNRFWRFIEQGGSPLGTGTEVLGTEPGVIKTSCVKQGVFFPNENKALADPAEYEARYRLVQGDLLIVRGSGSGDLVADCAVVTEEVAQKQLMLSDLVYRPVGLQLNPRFVCAFLLTPRGRSRIRMLVRQGSGPAKVRGEDIGSVPIPVLSDAEQSRFADRYWEMREHASRIDQAFKQSVDLLEERKRSLITAAVTGEVDVSSASSRAAGVALSDVGGVA